VAVVCQVSEEIDLKMNAIVSRLALGLTQPPVQWELGLLFPEIKWPGCEADHSHSASAEVNPWSYTSTPNTSSWQGVPVLN